MEKGRQLSKVNFSNLNSVEIMTKKIILVAKEAKRQIACGWNDIKIVACRMNNKTLQFSCTKEKCNRRHLTKQYY